MRARRTKAPHPGWACCDLTQDLAGWLNREHARVAIQRRWVRVLHARGHRLNGASITALIAGDRDLHDRLDNERRHAHGRANGIAQSMLIREGHADQVEAAHQWRLIANSEESHHA